MSAIKPELKPEFTTGTYVSAVGHAGLIGWLLLGWGLSAEPLPFEVTEVSVVTGAEYAAIVAATTPRAATDQPSAPSAPAVEEPTPPVAPEDPVAPAAAEAPPAPPTEEAPPPDPPEPLPPPTQVVETAPVLEAPAPNAAPDLPVIAERPQERPADRVSTTPTAPPPPDAEVAPIVQQEVIEAPAAAPTVEETPQDEAAPEAATDRLVTEVEEASGAPERVVRPPSRPADLRPPPPPETPAQTTTADSQNAADPADNTLDDLLTDLTDAPVAEAAAEPAPRGDPGPPMSFNEREGFRVAVSGCWTVDPGAQDQIVVTVRFELGRDRRVIGDRVELVRGEGGSDGAINTAFANARRAILRCQNAAGGFPLPAEKFEQWRDVEMIFDPRNVRY